MSGAGIDSSLLSDVDVLLAACSLLKDLTEVSPSRTVFEAASLHARIQKQEEKLGLFDERDYLLGELARIAAHAARLTGDYVAAEKWLDRADFAFRHTVNPAALLANVAYGRLVLRFQMNRFEDVADLLPSLRASYAKLGMDLEIAKCQFLEARLLQQTGKAQEANAILAEMLTAPALDRDRGLHGQVLVYLGAYQAEIGNYAAAESLYRQAIPVIKSGNRPAALAELKWALADTYRSQGNWEAAVEAYRSARHEFAKLEMPTYVAMTHLATADALLSIGRPREAELEVRAALPAIDSCKMVPEGLAAVTLLKESVQLRKTDPRGHCKPYASIWNSRANPTFSIRLRRLLEPPPRRDNLKLNTLAAPSRESL